MCAESVSSAPDRPDPHAGSARAEPVAHSFCREEITHSEMHVCSHQHEAQPRFVAGRSAGCTATFSCHCLLSYEIVGNFWKHVTHFPTQRHKNRALSDELMSGPGWLYSHEDVHGGEVDKQCPPQHGPQAPLPLCPPSPSFTLLPVDLS